MTHVLKLEDVALTDTSIARMKRDPQAGEGSLYLFDFENPGTFRSGVDTLADGKKFYNLTPEVGSDLIDDYDASADGVFDLNSNTSGFPWTVSAGSGLTFLDNGGSSEFRLNAGTKFNSYLQAQNSDWLIILWMRVLQDNGSGLKYIFRWGTDNYAYIASGANTITVRRLGVNSTGGQGPYVADTLFQLAFDPTRVWFNKTEQYSGSKGSGGNQPDGDLIFAGSNNWPTSEGHTLYRAHVCIPALMEDNPSALEVITADWDYVQANKGYVATA